MPLWPSQPWDGLVKEPYLIPRGISNSRDVGYDSVNTAIGALPSLWIVVEGCRAGNHILVNSFLRGVFILRPSAPRDAETWDVQLVLQQLQNLEPLC